MAKTIAEIQADIVTAKAADPILGPLLTSSSLVAIWYLWTWIVAGRIWVLANLFDSHKAEVLAIIKAQKPHTQQWYVTKVKDFQYGVALPADTDVYAIVPPVDPTVLIVTFAAAVEYSNLLRLKVAKGAVGALSALSLGELNALKTYMGRVKDAGVRLQVTTGAADTFQPTMVIFYDPLILDNTGARLDGTAATPVKDAVNVFLSSLQFNGRLALNSFIAAMQAVPGVVIAEEVSIQAFYGATTPVVITTWYVPDAGYLALDAAYFTANVSYVAYS